MAEFIVMKSSNGQIPPLSGKGQADFYRGDHVDGLAARIAAAAAFGSGPGVNLWSIPIAQLTQGTTSVSSS